ncbi:MAG: hypothetical protein J5J06_06830 [Phycisphaerae bacterium]|nr:hypothetical protein [Phycisphaerae bacterium]
MFTEDDPFAGVDLDNCIDGESGVLKPWAREFIESLASYSEISPSGRGVKVFVLAKKTVRECKAYLEDGVIEVYDRAKFFTITGNRLPSAPVEVHDRQTELDALCEHIWGGADIRPAFSLQGGPRGHGGASGEEIA